MHVSAFSFHVSRRLIDYLTRVLFSDGRQRRSSAEEFIAPKTPLNDWLNRLAAGVISTAYSYYSNSPPFCLTLQYLKCFIKLLLSVYFPIS